MPEPSRVSKNHSFPRNFGPPIDVPGILESEGIEKIRKNGFGPAEPMNGSRVWINISQSLLLTNNGLSGWNVDLEVGGVPTIASFCPESSNLSLLLSLRMAQVGWVICVTQATTSQKSIFNFARNNKARDIMKYY